MNGLNGLLLTLSESINLIKQCNFIFQNIVNSNNNNNRNDATETGGITNNNPAAPWLNPEVAASNPFLS